tara:strand:- start:329 stop:535 length:207 start_codon:yes stop_codon:yes gene_type:complete
MINSSYLYVFVSFIAFISLLFLFLNFKPVKNNINNKILLRNLLESLDLELPDELKQLDSSSTDSQKFS